MDIKISYRGVENHAEVEKHIKQQLKKIEEFANKEHGPSTLEFVVEQHAKFPNYKILVRMQMPSCKCVAEHEGADMYEAVNIVVDRLYTQIINCKERRVDRKKNGCDGECRNEGYAKDEAAAEFEVEEFIDLEDEE